MSGIIALFHLDGRRAEEATLERLLHPIRHRGVDGIKLWLKGSAGIAHLYLQNTPTSFCELEPAGYLREVAISFDGRLDNREELIRRLPRTAQDVTQLSDAACVVAAYAGFGDSFGQYLKGDFAIALFDGVQQKLLLLRDIMGIRPLYYCRMQETFLAASEIKSILEYPGLETRPDDDALADLLLAGDPYDKERTCFSRVSRVLPGHTVVVTRSKVHAFQHWDFDPMKQVRCAGIGEYAEVLRALFEQAVRRRLRSCHPVAVMVSGGLDSSAILCQGDLLKKAGSNVAACVGLSMTFPERTEADEKQFLSDIEIKHNITIQKKEFSRVRLMGNADSVRNSELPELHWHARSELLSLANQSGCRVVLDGYYGDQVLANPGYLVDLARTFRWLDLRRELAEWGRWTVDADPAMLQQELRWVLVQGLVPYMLVRAVRRGVGMTQERQPAWYARPFQERAFQRYVVSRQKSRRFVSYHAKTCYEFVNARRRVNSVEADNKIGSSHGLELAYPFMDADLIEFLLAIPGRVINWKGVPKGAFREAMKGILPESIRLRKWKADFTMLHNEAASSELVNFQKNLGPECLAITNGYIDPIGAARVLPNRRFDRTSILPAEQVAAAVALELWLRAFCSDKKLASHPASSC